MTEGDLFQFLLDEIESRPMTVSELNSEINSAVERSFASVWVEGEVVDFRQAGKGHWYFNLNDGTSSIKCVCWGGTNYRIRYKPVNGNTVRVRGKVTFWEARGELKLTINSLEPSGEGALKAAFEQIKARLELEGLFADELKRPIPFLPRRVAVITSKTGAAYHDIHNVLTRRARSVHLLLVNAVVQGESAASSLRNALIGLNRYNSGLANSDRIDVAIMGRGGGSAEDLWCFNDEALARAIRESSIPVISAVGHEIDWTIADLVSDLRAPTPSAAAEIVAAKEEDILSSLSMCSERLFELVDDKISLCDDTLANDIGALQAVFVSILQQARERLGGVERDLNPAQLHTKTTELSGMLSLVERRRVSAIRDRLSACSERLNLQMAKLDALSPLAVLTRGYSITQLAEGKVLRNSNDVSVGDNLDIRLERGTLEAVVIGAAE